MYSPVCTYYNNGHCLKYNAICFNQCVKKPVCEDTIRREWLIDYFSKGAGLFADNTETIISAIKSAPGVTQGGMLNE